MGVPQAASLAVGALLLTLVSYHVIFTVMALVTAAAAGYLVLRRSVFLQSAPAPQPVGAAPVR